MHPQRLSLLTPFIAGMLSMLGTLAAYAQTADDAERAALAAEGLSPEQIEQYLAYRAEILGTLERQTGNVSLRKANATLRVPESFYYLDPDDAQTVLVDVWGNPAGEKPLGMLFPAQFTPFDAGSWGVTIGWQNDGYVSDADANDIDYDDLLRDLQRSADESNRLRAEQGYPTVEIVGWAANPFYDADAHKLYWAKEIAFEDTLDNTLNYDIRVLGRRGVLVLSFIAGIQQQAEVDANLATVLAMAEFNEGDRYADYVDGDKLAGYGIGALVAGATGLALAKKGVFAAVLIFLKKFVVIIALGAAGLFRTLFGRKKTDEAT